MKQRLTLLLLFVFFVFGIYLLLPYMLEGMGRFLIVRDPLEKADIILVLAGDHNGERVTEGVKLFKEGYAEKILMSGGPLAWKLTSANWMKKQAIAMGVPAKAILIQGRSESTLEDAEFSFPIIKNKNYFSVILVTSPSHSRRSKRVFNKVFSKAGIKILSAPARKSRFNPREWWTRHEDTEAVVREYIAFVYYFIKGY
jgi:uncharacterized SAM-binding protein YcdF (DUF218 family)